MVDEDSANLSSVRQRVLDTILEEPGSSVHALASRLGVDWNTVDHHVRRLTGEGRIEERRRGATRLLFPAGFRDDSVVLELTDAALRVLRAVTNAGATSASELAVSLSVARSGIARHLKALSERGLLEVERRGRTVLYRPAPPLDPLDPAIEWA